MTSERVFNPCSGTGSVPEWTTEGTPYVQCQHCRKIVKMRQDGRIRAHGEYEEKKVWF